MKKYLSFVLIIGLLMNVLNFTLPQPVQASTIGYVNMDGDPTINSDDFADSSSNQYRWLSYPGSRLSLNPDQTTDCKTLPGAMDNRLSLYAGGWWGSNVKNFNEILRTQMAVTNGSPSTATSKSTTWYPYKINFNGSFNTPTGTNVSGYDMMLDANATILRVINISASAENDVVLSGLITGSGGGRWIGGNDKVILVSDTNYYYAIHIVSLTGTGLTPVELGETAAINGSEWTFRKHFTASGKMAVGIGFSTSAEGSAVAISRAKNVFSQDVATTVSNLKAYTDGLLRNVPAPVNWGISGIETYGVTSVQHKNLYYSAWTFVLQSLVNSLPENASAYPYPQVMCGKPSLWNVGDAACPGTSQWESLFGYQMLSFVMPETSWQAFLGLLSRVDSNGVIAGESLPTRMAQTAWILYQNLDNTAYLNTAYTAIKRHLLWAQDNPRWIYGSYNIPEEKDLEFIASYMWDAEFAIKIANELGITSDVALWQNERSELLSYLNQWFFKDSDVIYGVCYDYTTIPKEWAVGNDMYKATALAIDGLTASQRQKLNEFFMSVHKTGNPADNFPYHKYPDVSVILEGLIENGGQVQAQEFAKVSLRDTIRAKEFGEAIIASGNGSASGGVKIESVVPSIFTAIEAIHLTWLLNNFRFDHDTFSSFTFNNSSLTVPNSTDIIPNIEDFSNIKEWDNTYNSYLNAVGGSGIFRFYKIVNETYGVVDKQVTYNVTDYPKLTIHVEQVYGNAKWALKVNDGGAEIQLQGDTSQTGDITYDLKNITGWSGNKTFKIRVYVIDGDVKISGIDARNTIENFGGISDWTCPENATITAASGIGTVTATGSYGYAKKTVTYDVSANPKLRIKIAGLGAGSQWALKVNGGGADITLQSDTSLTGELEYNLGSITGWTGTKTFDIKLFSIGGNGKSVMVDYIYLP